MPLYGGSYRMKNKKWYEWLLPFVFAAMVLLCVVLNLSGGQKEGLSNILVNAAMFVIVMVIFLSCDLGSFCPMNDICAELDRATKKIRSDAMNSHQYLWEPYSASNTEFFENPRLKEIYQDYLFELNRVKGGENAYYKCNIEDYVNDDLVDSVMHRNQLNQVASVLTGLGILGTFIGLSLGLQSFNTGSTAEITSSVEPLMNGIKVAFHTSIYGMVFSLVFNFVYKKKLYDAEEAVRGFVSAWKKFVLPDMSDDGTNRMLELQEKQLKAFREMGQRMSEEVAAQLDPNFEKLGKLITDFQAVATVDQRTSLQMVVNEFIKEMNRSLKGSFDEIAAAVDGQYRQIKANENIMNQFAQTVTDVEGDMKKDILSLSMQAENNRLLKNEWQQGMKDVVDSCSDAADSADQLRAAIERMQKSRRQQQS